MRLIRDAPGRAGTPDRSPSPDRPTRRARYGPQRRLSIMAQISVFLLLTACGAVTALLLFIWTFHQAVQDSHLLVVVVAQRHLVEQLQGYARMVHGGQSEDRPALRELTAAFDRSLDQLGRGGSAAGRQTPAAPREIQDALAGVRHLWEATAPAVRRVAEQPASSAAGRTAYGLSQQNLSALGTAADRVLAALQRRNLRLERQLIRLLAAIAAFDLLLILAGARTVRMHLAERRRAEDRLRESEARFRGAFESDLIGIVFWESGGRILDVNDVALQLFGRTRRDLEGGLRWEDLCGADSGEGCSAALRELATREHCAPVETECRRADGTRVPVLIGGARLEGHPEHRLCFVLDDRGRQQALDALRRDERRLAEAQQLAHVGSWELDLATGAITWSEEHYRIFGVDPGGFTANYENYLHLLHPADREQVRAEQDRALRERLAFDLEHRIVRPDGIERIIHSRGEVICGEQGEPLRMVGTVQDVTESRRAAASLEEHVRQALLSAEVGVALTSGVALDEMLQRCAEAAVHHLDAAFARIWTLDEVAQVLELKASAGQYTDLNGSRSRVPVGQFKIGLIASERRAHLSNDVQHDPHVSDHEWARREGMVAFAGHPLLVEGRLVGVLALFARKSLSEATLQALGAVADGIALGIERQQGARARERLEAQLLQSQKMEAVGRLAGGIAHDFNNLLTVILGFGNLTLKGLPAGDPLRGKVQQVVRAGERAAALTRQLLVFSRKQVLQAKVLDLGAVAEELEKMLRRMIGEDIELATVVPADLGLVKADPSQLEQVLLNLVINARDAMPEGGKLTIELSNAALPPVAGTPGPPLSAVLLAVTDTGVGMDAEVRSHIFEPFFTTKDQGKGTGLGLSTVYGIVQQSGGQIAVYSEPGHGTCFKVYLPRVDEPVEAAAPAAEAPPPRGTETVLLVEDEEGVRDLARETLAAQGYLVLEAASAREALETAGLRYGSLDLVLTDVVLPGMSGPALVAELAARGFDSRVLFMSGFPDRAVLRHGVLELGAAFLAKPFTPDELARKVRTVLDASAAEEADPAIPDQEAA